MKSSRHVVIVGGGFAGLQVARALRRAPVRITLVDRQNHHLFQPLLYQVATAGLPPQDIAMPIRSALERQRNSTVLLAEAHSADPANKVLHLADGRRLDYDYLVVAAGASTSYYGHDEWSEIAPGLKDLRHAVRIRERILMAFEAAEQEPDPSARARLLTFVVIGGGPTGVELAGAISELGRHAMARDFRLVSPRDVRVILMEMADRVLTPFHPSLSAKAKRMLEELNVEVRLNVKVEQVCDQGVQADGNLVPSATVLWGAGVKPDTLASRLGVPTDRRGAIIVEQDCSVPKHPSMFAIGDIAAFTPPGAERPLPGLAPVAIQQGRHVGRLIRREVHGQSRPSFRYVDKGTMATVGRSRAVLESGRVRFGGLIAWLAWMFVHVWYLNGFRNRTAVLFNWVWSYLSYRRGARLIVDSYDRPDVAALARPSKGVLRGTGADTKTVALRSEGERARTAATTA